jgi:hypothetical protein
MNRSEENTRDTEIVDVHEALGRLFCSRFGAANCYALLIVTPLFKGDDAPRIERDAVGGAYGMEVVRRRVWYVSERVARELIARGWVDAGLARWGYTDANQRRLTDVGESEWFRFSEACADSVQAFARWQP